MTASGTMEDARSDEFNLLIRRAVMDLLRRIEDRTCTDEDLKLAHAIVDSFARTYVNPG